MTRRNGTGIALLADETRRMIIGLVALRARRPWELAAELQLSRPAISRQLAILAEAGLIRIGPSWIDGRGRVVRLNPENQGRILAWLAGTDLGLEEGLVSRMIQNRDRSARSKPVDE
jgi:DNA-binding MarR family transcriptional regulator